MIIKYDERAKAIYIKVNDIIRGRDGSCEELIEDTIIIDRNKDGIITGIEILFIDGVEDCEGNRYSRLNP